jgi:L-iditol 2-dehydrogenase
MRAVLFDTNTLEFSLADVPEPKLPPDEVLLRVETTGICGSDLHLVETGLYGGEKVTEPAILGHEFSAVIEEIGPDAADPRLEVGQRVAVEPTISCGECEFCRAGRENICPNHVFRGMPPCPGGLQEYVTMPSRNVFPVPEILGADEAMIAEPLAIAVHAKRIADIQGGETVAVVGCGPIGLLTMKALDLAGAAVVLAVEPVDERREVAHECGAETAVSPDEDPVGAFEDMTDGRLADIVVEAAGPPDALRIAMRLVRPGGTLVYAGIHPGQMAIDFTLARRREMVWKWVRRTVNAYPETIELLASGKIDGKRFVTHHWPMEKATEAFRVAAAYRDGIIKGAVDIG